jgi:hypothetical protein
LEREISIDQYWLNQTPINEESDHRSLSYLVAGTPDNYRDEPVSAVADMSPTSYQLLERTISIDQYWLNQTPINEESDHRSLSYLVAGTGLEPVTFGL